jgi:hypothetical protein
VALCLSQQLHWRAIGDHQATSTGHDHAARSPVAEDLGRSLARGAGHRRQLILPDHYRRPQPGRYIKLEQCLRQPAGGIEEAQGFNLFVSPSNAQAERAQEVEHSLRVILQMGQ